MNQDAADWINLSLVPGLGPATYRVLLSSFGLPSQVLAASRSQLECVVGAVIADAIKRDDRHAAIQATLAWLEKPANYLITLADTLYPGTLLEIPDPPPIIYVSGDPALLSSPALAIVGSRNSTAQGRENATQFARTLSRAGLTIVSGLALGIDAAAHWGGLDGRGSTVAVVGTGVNLVYPRANEKLAVEVRARGALISEFPLGTSPIPGNFPRRNRLISGLARGVLVIEAAVYSGSLITAKLAAEQGREVLAIPGSIHSPLSRGCHALIKQGAKLVESAQDVLDELRIERLEALERPENLDPNISGSETDFLRDMGYDPCNIDTLAERSRLTPAAVSAMLLQLELEGRVASLPGGLFQRIR